MTLLEAANEYILEGFNPLPLKQNKTPMLMQGHPFLYEKIDRIEDRFSKCEKIGIACGNVSDGFYCIDFDCHKGQDIEPIFMEFFDNPSVQYLINTDMITVFRTPSGGFHFYFKLRSEIKGKAISRYKDGSTMIEIRGHGQYVAVYPSEGYEYIAGCEIIKLDYIDLETYAWLKDMAESFTQISNLEKSDIDQKTRKWPDKWDDSKVDGNFNNNQADYAKQLLIEVGWRLICVRNSDGVEMWEKPRAQYKDQVSATFGVNKNMFYVFSTSAIPFESNKGYSPFDIYTKLKFNGDWKLAKDSLKPKLIVTEEPITTTEHKFFPIDVFPKFIQDYIMELQRTLNFHPDFTAASVMFAVSSINGNKYKLKVKTGWEAPTIFWFACVGYPGTIKTHPVKTMINPLYKIDRKSKDLYDEEIKHYDPESKPRQPKPKFKQLLISDYTIEALHSIHDINSRGIGLYKDELVGFLNDMNKYRKGSDEQFWLESFNNGTHTVNRVTKEPIMINNICINMIGTIQHDVLNKIISEYQGNGLIDRFLFTSSETKVYELNDLNADDYYAQKWNDVITRMHDHFIYHKSEDTEIVRMTPEAFKMYQKIDAEYVNIQNSEEETQGIKNYLAKMKTYIPRFALLLSITESIFNDDYIIVNEKHMINAGRMADYFISTARGVFDANSMSNDINEVANTMRGMTRDQKISELHKKGFSQASLSKHFSISRTHVGRILKKV